MFECKYKFTLTDCVQCAKYVYKSQKKKKDTIMAILVPVLIVAMIVLLVLDAVNGKPILWDIILIIALVILETMYLVMPLILFNSQKKSYKKQKLDEMDYLHIKITDNLCVETLYKDEKEVAKNVHNLKLLTSYLEDSERLVLVFNNIEFTCIKKSELVGDLNKLKSTLEKYMFKRAKH